MTTQETRLHVDEIARDIGSGLWLDQAMFLCGKGRTVTTEVRLAHYRAQRATQRLPKDACFYSIAFVLTEIAEKRNSKTDVSKVADSVLTATFREYGENEMATLFVKEPKEFRRRMDSGLRYLRDTGTHVHRWKLVDPYAFGGPVFVCRKCNQQMEQTD
jgi:hypothetical protein